MNWGTAHEKDAVLCAFVQVCRVLCLALCHGGVRGTESEFVCVGGGGSLPLSGVLKASGLALLPSIRRYPLF